MKAAITGATGFVGGRLLSRCQQEGISVRALSRHKPELGQAGTGIEWCHGDLDNAETLTAFVDGVDVLYHCAGQLVDKAKMHQVHVTGTESLIRAADGRVGRWVQLSSVGVYGSVAQGVVTEQWPLRPLGEYETTKAESDELVMQAMSRGCFDACILRPSNVYGPNMRNQSLFSLISMIDKGLFFFIGKPAASANYIHVDNVVEGLILAGIRPEAKGQIFNVSQHCSMEEFVRVISDALGRPAPAVYLPEVPVRWMSRIFGMIPGFPLTPARVDALTNRSIYAVDQINQVLGYSPVMSIEQGLRQMVDVYKRAK